MHCSSWGVTLKRLQGTLVLGLESIGDGHAYTEAEGYGATRTTALGVLNIKC